MTLSPSLLAVCQSVTCSSIAVFFGGDLGRFRRYQLLSSRGNQQNPTRTSPSAFPPPKKKHPKSPEKLTGALKYFASSEVFDATNWRWTFWKRSNCSMKVDSWCWCATRTCIRSHRAMRCDDTKFTTCDVFFSLWGGSHFKNQVPKNDLYNGMIGYPLVN